MLFYCINNIGYCLLDGCSTNHSSGEYYFIPLLSDLADSDEISKLLEQAGEERRAVESTEDVSLGGAFPLPPASPSPATVVVPPPSPTAGNDSGVETNDPPLTPSQIQSININFDEFDLARATSKIL